MNTPTIPLSVLTTPKNQLFINNIIQHGIQITVYKNAAKPQKHWSVVYDSSSNQASIYAGRKVDDTYAFTHELLHILEEVNGQMSHIQIPFYIQFNNSSFRFILRNGLLNHINNIILHVRILPIYLNAGLKRSKFVYDYYNKPQSKYHKHFKFNLTQNNKIDIKALSNFLSIYFSYRFHPNKASMHSYARVFMKNYAIEHNDLISELDKISANWENNPSQKNNIFFDSLLNTLDTWKANNNYT